MDIGRLLNTATEQGVLLYLKNGKLIARPEGNYFPDTLKAQIVANKPAIIDYLAENDFVINHSLQNLQVADNRSQIMKRPRNERVPASFAQQRLWFIAQLEGDNEVYHTPEYKQFNDEVSFTALRSAFEMLVLRHESLRTVFEQHEGTVYQVILSPEEIGFALESEDVSHLTDPAKTQAVNALSDVINKTPFDLAKGPMLRACLVKLAQQEYALLMNMHHIVNDEWSMGIVTQELDALYHACLAGKDNPLDDLPIQYADFAIWQHEQMADEQVKKQSDYWQQQLSDVPPLISLPADHARPERASYQGRNVPVRLDPRVSRRVEQLSKAHGMTVHMVLFAVWAALLSRISGQAQVAIGIPVANRQRSELEGLIGFFINTLVLKVDFDNTTDVLSLFEQVKKVTLEGYARQEFPFEKVVELLQPERSLNHSPVFQVMFVLTHDEQDATAEKADEKTHQADTSGTPGISKFDLSLDLSVNSHEINGSLEYATDLFEHHTVVRWVGYFESLVQVMLDAAEARSSISIRQLNFLTQVERERLLIEFNDTGVDYPRDKCIHEMFELQANRTPEATALVYEGDTLSYRTVNQRANQLAHYLICQGVKPDALVGLYVERSLEMVIGILGILKAGGAYVPIDPTYPQERITFMLSDSNVALILTQTHLTETLPLADQQLVCLDASEGDCYEAIQAQPDNNPERAKTGLLSSCLAYVIYTSGTTGQPKGVMNEHDGVRNRLQWMQDKYNLQHTDVVLQKTPFSFDVSVWEFFWPLIVGARLVIARPGGHQEPDYLVSRIVEQGVTHLHFVPSMLNAMMELKDVELCTSVKRIICSGEALSMSSVESCRRRLPWAQIENLYGPTEAAIDVTYWSCTKDMPYPYVPIGAPISNIQMYILDAYKQPVPTGVAGEIYIGGAGVARGYLNRPDLTAERFVVDTLHRDNHGRLYKTGDLGCWQSDGTIRYLGRNDHQVKIRGFRIELGEIEAQLQQQDAIQDALVVAYDTDSHGKQLVGYVTPAIPLAEGKSLDLMPVRQALSAHLPEFMVPSQLMVLEAFPLTPNGKIDRKALPKPDDSARTQAMYEAPIGDTETLLAQLWQEMLGVENVSRHDSFFALGGHSLLIIRLIAELQGKGITLKVSMIFERPVLMDLARELSGEPQVLFQAPPNLIEPDSTLITPDMLPLISLTQEHIDLLASQIPGGMANIEDIYPLGPLQEGLLFHHIKSDKSKGDTYVSPMVLAMQDSEEADRFVAVLEQVIARHEVLRTAIFWEGLPRAAQVVQRHVAVTVNEHQLLADKDVVEQLDEYTTAGTVWLDLRKAPLLKVDRFSIPQSSHCYIVVHQHHIINDHIGMEVLEEEIEHRLQGDLTALGATVPYREFVAHALELSKRDETRAYFNERFGDMDEPTLPFGQANVQVAPENISRVLGRLTPDLSKCIRRCCGDLQVSVASLFHLVWGLVTGRLSDRDDVVFGTVLSGRLQGATGAAQTVGLFNNTLPLRIKIKGSTTTLLQQTHRELLSLLDHEQAPVTMVRECTALSNDAPLFTCVLNFRGKSLYEMEAPDLSSTQSEETDLSFDQEQSAIDIEVAAAEALGYNPTNFPLTLCIDDAGNGPFGLDVQTAEGIKADKVLGYIQQMFKSVVAALMGEVTCPVHQLGFLSEADVNRLLTDFNDTNTDYPHDRCIHELFETQVASTPGATAVMFEGETLSYQVLNQQANQLAHYLIEQGVKPDTLVGLCMERSFEMVIGLMGILKAGGAYVPLDPGASETRLAYQISDSGMSLVLTQEAIEMVLSELPCETLCLDQPECLRLLSNYATDNPLPDDTGLTSAHLAYVIYTSGTTGQPKGVMTEHRNLANYVCWALEHLYEEVDGAGEQGTAIISPFSFDFTVTSFYPPLLRGQSVTLLSDDSEVSDLLTQLRSDTYFSLVKLTPSHLNMMEALLEQGQGDNPGCGLNVHTLVCGGEALTGQALTFWRKYAPGARLVNHYGPTETTVGVCTYAVPKDYQEDHVPIGAPIANTQIVILNAHRQLVPEGVAGEIYVGGAGVARGYLNRPGLTSDRFIPDVFSHDSNARLYRTGDLGYWQSDGTIRYLGRNDHQVKIRGFRVELGEIQAQLQQQNAIHDALVVAYDGDNNEKQLVGYVTPAMPLSEGESLDLTPIRQKLSDTLPEYMVPSHLMVLDAFPLTPNGKIDRNALPKPDDSALAKAKYEAPVGDTEILLARIWRDLLGVDNISRHDSFFTLGGHSLLAVRLISQVQQQLQRELPLATLFEQPILKNLAYTLEATQFAVQTPITPVSRGKHMPVSWAQQRVWFIAQLEGGSEAYHIPQSVPFDGELSVETFELALKALVARHEPLRTVFHEYDGEPVQVIQPAEENAFALGFEDLSHYSGEEQGNALTALADNINTTPFDLENGPLFRALLVKLAPESHILLVNMHHIVTDGWSMDIIVQEVDTLYQAFLDGHENPLAPLSIQYADYAMWQREYLSGEVLDSQAAYWQQHLGDAPPLISLPTDYQRPERLSYRGGSVPVYLDQTLTQRIDALANQMGMTVQMVMLAAWSILLSRLSGQSQVVIGTPVANRQRHEVESLVGFFVNTLALKVDMDGITDITSLLRQVKDITLSGYAHQDIPFEQVVELLQPERSLSHTPLFQVMFDYTHDNDLSGTDWVENELSAMDNNKPVTREPDAMAKYDLTLDLTLSPRGLHGGLTYAIDLFEETTIIRHAAYFERLVKVMLDSAEAADALAVQQYDFMPLAERQKLLINFNDNHNDFPQDKCIHEMFEVQAASSPQATALVLEGETLSYQLLNQRANQVAHYLIQQNVKPNTLIGLCVERSFEMVIGILGILKAGGAYVPIDPTYPNERITYMLSDSDVSILLTQSHLKRTLPLTTQKLVCLDAIESEDNLVVQSQSTENISTFTTGLTSAHRAYVIYTSGTTGQPKGVLISHMAAMNYLSYAVGEYFAGTSGAVVSTALSFDATVTSLLGPLVSGGFCHLLDGGQVEHELTTLRHVLSTAEAPMVFKLTPGHLTALGATSSNDDVISDKPHRLVIGGESLDMDLALAWTQRYCPGAVMFNEYGPTEATVGCCLYRITHKTNSSQMRTEASVPIGHPLMNTQLYVVDRNLQLVPEGVSGELLIGGAGLAQGYLNQPALTQDKFIPNPFYDRGKPDRSACVYRTGDMVRMLPDGHLAYQGRNDQQVKIRGFRIEPGEIQAQLQRHELIRDALVMAYHTDKNDKQLVGYVTSAAPVAEGETFDLTPVRQALSDTLPNYMVPSHLVVLDAFPLTANGKIDRKALPKPDESALAQVQYEAPINEVEEILVKAIQDVLEIQQVGRHDNYFVLGGTSLRAFKVINLVKKKGYQLELISIYSNETIAKMAGTIRKLNRSEANQEGDNRSG